MVKLSVKPLSISWIGLDTETQNGKAILICTPDHALVFPTNFSQIFKFLNDCKTLELIDKTQFCCFNLKYDATAILLYLPISIQRQFRFKQFVNWRNYQFSFLPRKELVIWNHKTKQDVRIYDVAQFFAGSLNSVSQNWLGESKQEVTKQELENMELALKTNPTKIIAYCKHDALLTEKLMTLLANQFTKLDIDFSRPLSPATLSYVKWKENLKFSTPYFVNKIFQRGYHGGRIEVYQRGFINGPLYLYDVNSCYPAELANLISPIKSESLDCKHYCPNATYAIYQIIIKISPSDEIPPLPVSINGVLCYPTGVFKTWVSKSECETLIEYGYDFEIVRGLELWTNNTTKCFPDIPELYKIRKANPDVGYAIKIMLNGLYGKIAQNVDVWAKANKIDELASWNPFVKDFIKRDKRSASFTHFALASAVTSGARIKLWRKMKDNPSNTIMCMTDSILTTKRWTSNPTENELGEWALQSISNNAVIIGSGIYSLEHDACCPCKLCKDTDGIIYQDKMRGLPSDLSLREILNQSGDKIQASTTLVDTFNCLTTKRNPQVNIIRKINKTININFDRKRHWDFNYKNARDMLKKKCNSSALVYTNLSNKILEQLT